MPYVGVHRLTGTQVRHPLDARAPPVLPCTGTHYPSCPAWVCAIRRALDGYTGRTCPGWVRAVSHAMHWYAPSIMPGMGVHRQTCPGWVRRSDMPWMGMHRQSCPAWVCTVRHALDRGTPSDVPWMGKQAGHALDGYEHVSHAMHGMHVAPDSRSSRTRAPERTCTAPMPGGRVSS